MLKQKAIKFIKLNILLQPILMLLGLVSSIFVIRELGEIVYANIVVLSGVTVTATFLLSLGISATLNKLWIEFDHENDRQAIILFTILIQMFLMLLLLLIFYINNDLLKFILGDFTNKISLNGFILIIISVIISTISSSILTAELDNKVTFKSSFFMSIGNSFWLILSSNFMFNIENILMGLIIINSVASLILLFGTFKYMSYFKISSFRYLKEIIIKKYIKFYLMISFIRVHIYLTSLAFLSLILNYFNMLQELAYLAVIIKILSIVSTIFGIPINKVIGVLFINAFKRKDQRMINKLYGLILKYNAIMYSLAFVGLFYFLHEFILIIYNLNINNYVLILFLLNLLVTPMLNVSNFITNFNEHYTVVYISAFLATCISQLIILNFIQEYNLIAIGYGILANTIIYSGIGMIFVSIKYKYVNIPLKFLSIIFIVILITIFTGFVINNYILSSFISIFTFVILFYILYSPLESEVKLLFELLPRKFYDFLPKKYQIHDKIK